MFALFAAIGTDHEGNEITLADVMGTSPDAVTDEVERRTSAQRLRTLVDSILTQRERVVVVLRYGLSGQGCLAQREVAKLLGISRSYVSRIEKKGSGKTGRGAERREQQAGVTFWGRRTLSRSQGRLGADRPARPPLKLFYGFALQAVQNFTLI